MSVKNNHLILLWWYDYLMSFYDFNCFPIMEVAPLINAVIKYQIIVLHTIDIIKDDNCDRTLFKFSTNFSDRESESVKKCWIDIHLNVDLFSFNKYCLYKLVHMIVIHYQNETLYNISYLWTFVRSCWCL